jgi:hypothetical protein
MFYAVKLLASAFIIVLVSELAKRNSLLGGLIASLPLVSLLAITWLYIETKSVAQVSSFSISVFWMVLPSLSFFLLLPVLLKKQVSFPIALPLTCLATSMVYFACLALYEKLGIKV